MDEIKINTEIQKWNERDIVINKKTLLPEDLLLSYSQNRLTFDVRSFNYCDVNELLYSFYLEGFDKNPSEYSFNRTADFPNLNSGKYTFHVRAKDLSGNPSNEIVFSFEITPPFYKTWWFLILMILCFSGIVYFYIQYRTRKLTAEKNILEEKVAQRTSFIEKQKVEIEKQKEIIEDKNREVIESITYARRIQRAMVTSSYYINKHLKDYFILFKPKDIVSGDFYWVYNDPNNKGTVYVVTADCTGHGVPGGFMSMMGINLLKAIIQGRNILNTKDIINTLRSEIISNLNPEGAIEEAKDGMDMVISKFDFENMKLEFSAANNGLYLLRNNKLTEYKGEKMPVGKGEEHFKDFSSQTIDLQKGDIIYTFTDGYADQFGGPKGKKFKYKQLEQLLLNNSNLAMDNQKSILNQTIDQWRGEQEQVDDILLIGVRI